MEDDFVQVVDFYLRFSFSYSGVFLYNLLFENIREIKLIVEVRK